MRRSLHKKDCKPKDKRDLSIKLAQRVGTQVTIMGMLSHAAILELDVLSDPRNSHQYYLRIPVRVQHPDLSVVMQRVMERKPQTQDGETLCLQLGEMTKAPRAGAHEGIEAEFIVAQKHAVDAGQPPDAPVAVFCYYSEETPTSFVVASVVLLPDLLAYAASKPVMTVQSAMFGTVKQPWDQVNLRECVQSVFLLTGN